ncbi:hypothetical protein Tco_0589153 [Tanacetum coccineum]
MVPLIHYVPKSLPPSQVLATLAHIKSFFPNFDAIIKERTTVKPLYVFLPYYEYAKEFALQQVVPFLDYFKTHVQTADDTIVKEVAEFKEIHYALKCDREHNKVLELEAEISKQKRLITESEKRFAFLEQNYVSLQLKFQNYKQCSDTSSASNAIFEINKLRDQLQGKDATIRNLDAQINIMKVLNVGSTEGSCDQQALDTDRIQLKDMITSLRIQLDGLKINALTAENAKLKTELSGKMSSGFTASEKPKVLASGMYTNSSKYVPPPKRANWVKPTPLPKKKQVTFQEPLKTSNRPTQKPLVQQNKKPNVPVNLSTRTKPATESRKPMPKSHTQNHHILPSKSVNARRSSIDHNSEVLMLLNHESVVIRSLSLVITKPPGQNIRLNHAKKVWKATRNHNEEHIKTALETN